MNTYRYGPMDVQARQLTPENGRELWEWADSKPHYAPGGEVDGLTIYTRVGRKKADFGDWIVKNADGEFYPVKDGIFEAAYDLVAAAEQGGEVSPR